MQAFGELPGQDSSCPKSHPDKGDRTDQETLAHALPTSRVEDPDLALIVGLWGRLTDECKRRVIEIVQADPPSNVDADDLTKSTNEAEN
jgi:hypothetical protein